MKKLVFLLLLAMTVMSCKETVRIVVDAQGVGSFNIEPSKEIKVSGSVNGQIDSLTTEFTTGKQSVIKDIKIWSKTPIESVDGNVDGLVRVYINNLEVAKIPFNVLQTNNN
ncbi:MAG: hypothetical protein Nk1A_8460 [Endomicrobiia bacterium]|nr:MAG: hypothetical protein Nk1A_8460 [Endomicrobiia bacterium]